MKGDFSKFKSPQLIAKEHNLNVFQQQGRVSLDQDWNEQSEINRYRSETALCDVIGKSGAPFDNAGFKIEEVLTTSPPASPIDGDLKISAGHYYVDGILCENDEDVSFEDQRDFPGQKLPEDPGYYLFYLDVWLRHFTVLEDKYLREVALGGPDTTTRTKVVWQVKCAKITDTSPISPPDCSGTDFPDETRRSTGTLSARSNPSPDSTGPCSPTATGGYTRLQNQLYRVEIHKGSEQAGGPTYKWSRDNGSVVVSWQDYDPTNPAELKVSSLGKDDLLGFNAGDLIEIIDDTTDLLNKPGILATIAKPPQNNTITIETASIIYPAGITSISLGKGHPRIRKWDSQGELPVKLNTWSVLEDGVEAKFRINEADPALVLKTGDHWMIPARPAIPDVEWIKDLFLPPFGIRHHYAKLAIADFDATKGWSIISDCRNLFPSLTELTSLYYVGGDGQEAMPGAALPEPLMVGVANGSWAVAGAKVKFEILSPGGGFLDAPPDGIVTTGSDGIAKCKWTLDTSATTAGLQVRASLLDDAGDVIPQRLPVIFSAGFSVSNNRKKCSFTVGTGGDFEFLIDAIFKLSEQKMNDVNLCLLPGEHHIDKDIPMIKEKRQFQTLKISGYGARIIMKAKRMELAAGKLVLHGFLLTTKDAQNNEEDSQIILSAAEVIIDHCQFVRNGTSSLPFVSINKIAIEGAIEGGVTVYVTNSSFLAFFSLILTNGVQGVIEKNLITFLVLQNNDIKEFKPAQLGWITTTKKEILRNLSNREIVNATDWALTLRGNRVGAIITDVNRPSPQDFYQSIIVSENIFQLAKGVFISNSFAAQRLTMVNNQFLYLQEANDTRPLAFVLGLSAIITGNISIPLPVPAGLSFPFIDANITPGLISDAGNLLVIR